MTANRLNPFGADGNTNDEGDGTTVNGASSTTHHLSISDSMDGGNIEFVSQHEEDEIVVSGDGGEKWTSQKLVVQLKIKLDPYTELEKKQHGQYFCFRATLSGIISPAFKNVEYVIINAGEVSYPGAFQDYTVCFTNTMTDTLSWRRNPNTVFDKEKGTLSWTTTHRRSGSIYFSYFPPFTNHQHMALIDACASRTEVGSLGQSVFGRDLDCVVCGKGHMIAWIIHRQHPGEAQAEYFAEGLLNRLLGLSSNGDVDGLVRRVLQLYTFYIVPNMCPDGSLMGHWRTNAVGANLNREWATDDATKVYTAPSLERSPEIYHVWNKMQTTGVDFFLDVQANQDFAYNFLKSAKGTENWGSRLRALHGNFVDFYMQNDPDIQTKFGHDMDTSLAANISVSAVANQFNCLSMVLEMPYKDCKSNPNPEVGWSPNRCRSLGASILHAMDQIHPFLRDDKKWMFLPDKYVEPIEDCCNKVDLSEQNKVPTKEDVNVVDPPEKCAEPTQKECKEGNRPPKDTELTEQDAKEKDYSSQDAESTKKDGREEEHPSGDAESTEEHGIEVKLPITDAVSTGEDGVEVELPDSGPEETKVA